MARVKCNALEKSSILGTERKPLSLIHHMAHLAQKAPAFSQVIERQTTNRRPLILGGLFIGPLARRG